MHDSTSGTGLPVLWLITDQLPYPPRNGITLPIFNYIKELRLSNDVRVILLVSEDAVPTKESILENERIYGRISQITVGRKGVFERVVGELLLNEMYQHG